MRGKEREGEGRGKDGSRSEFKRRMEKRVTGCGIYRGGGGCLW